MAKLSQKQLEEMANKRKKAGNNNRGGGETDSILTEQQSPPKSKVINEIMGDINTQLYKYSLPDSNVIKKGDNAIPFVDHNEYPELNITGKASRDRQAKPIKFYLLKEVDHIINNISNGSNKTATLNFLVWVGLQTLKGMNQSVDIRVHDDTYADGMAISEFIDDKQ